MRVVWNGALDKERQEQARLGVPPKRRVTFSLIGDTGHQGSVLFDPAALAPAGNTIAGARSQNTLRPRRI